MGHFVILRQLGRGGMGVVYAAYDEKLDRKIAIKVLHEAAVKDGAQRTRVLREAQAMAQVSHPNVVHAYEVGEVDGQVFLAMEYVEGTTLTQWQRSPDRSWQAILQIYREAGQGLLAAHRVGLVHRDFKPENVLVGQDGRPRVADFGLAYSAGRRELSATPGSSAAPRLLESPLTAEGGLAGTPAYMSPEQHRGEEVDPRSDQFSFCAALYESLYGHRPFSGSTVAELAANTIGGKLLPPPGGSPVPQEIHRALVRGLSADPALRFPSMAELLLALSLEQGHTPAGAGISRRQLLNAVVVAVVLGNMVTQSFRSASAFAIGDVLAVDSFIFSVLILGGIRYRQTLLRNTFHRRIFSICGLYLAQKLILDGVALRYQVPFLTFLIMDLIGLAGWSALLAAISLPTISWLPVLILVAAILLAKYGPALLWLTMECYPIAGGALAIAWNSAAVHAHRELLGQRST